MVAVVISTMALGVVMATFVNTARAMTVVTDQTRRQMQAALALDRMVEILRNATYPATISSATEVRFTDVRHPGVIGRIWLSGESVMYDPDTSDLVAGTALAEPISGLTISPDPDPLIGASALQLQISYAYQNFREYFPNQSRNATFVTSVFLRN
jgi:hypothetical protein